MKTSIMIVVLFSSLTMLQAQSKIESILDNYMQAWAEHNITKIDTF